MKKIICCIIMSLCIMMSGTEYVIAEVNSAMDLTSANKVTISSGENGKVLSDGKFATSLSLKKGTIITIENAISFNSVYIIWNHPVKEYTVTSNNAKYTLGQNKFLHEYKKLNSETNQITIGIPEDAVLCDVFTFADGVLPDWVQNWSTPYKNADMLLLPTHSSDEIIFFGGTIPYYACEKGLKVQVAYMVSHESEPYRIHEALNAIWTMGLKVYPVFGSVPDAYVGSLERAKIAYDYDELVEAKVELIRRFKPEVIIGMDLKGEYGHGGHIIDAMTLVDALELSDDSSKCPDSYNRYGGWEVAKTYLHLYNQGKIKMDWDIPLSSFGNQTAFQKAQEGLGNFVSQIENFPVLKTSGVYDCTSFGLYKSTVGADTGKNDFIENIIFDNEDQSTLNSIDDSSDSANQNIMEDNSDTEKNKSSFKTALISSLVVLFSLIIMLILKRNLKEGNFEK